MVLSITFSFVIFRVASDEIQIRLERLQTNLQQSKGGSDNTVSTHIIMMEDLRQAEVDSADTNLSTQLVYANLFVLFIGGFISYFLARRSLAPIEKAHEAQSRFTSDASHELRTPLAVMKTELEVALRDVDASTYDLKEVLKSNLEEVDKLTKLSEMLLSISKIDNAGLKLRPVNLTKITQETIKRFGKPAGRIHLKLSRQQIVYGNEVAIADIVKILIDNALLYSPIDSIIDISISSENHNVLFEISNAGSGIEPDKIPHIFDRFYRADSSRTNGKHKGYGLGLALAKNIAELHNGQLSVTSTPNEMTTFTLVLPKKSDTQ